MAGLGSRVDLRGPAEWLPGIVFKQKKGVAQDPSLGSSTPGIWESLPLDATYLGGSLLPHEGNVESSQSLGVETLKTGEAFYLLLALVSNEGGSAEARILGALYLPSQYDLGSCSKNG